MLEATRFSLHMRMEEKHTGKLWNAWAAAMQLNKDESGVKGGIMSSAMIVDDPARKEHLVGLLLGNKIC